MSNEEENEDIEFESGSDYEFEECDEGELEFDLTPDVLGDMESPSSPDYFPIENEGPVVVDEEEDETTLYEIIHEAILFKSIQADITKLQGYLFLDVFTTCQILKHYGWRIEKVLDVYFNKGKDFVFKEIGLSTFISGNKSKDVVECPCCMDDVKKRKTYEISPCGHFFCRACFKNYFKTKLADGIIDNIPCPQMGCKTKLTSRIVNQFIPSKKKEIRRQLVKDYIKMNKSLSYCPHPDCGFLAKIVTTDAKKSIGCVDCECGGKFCPNCQFKGNHQPATCLQVEDWKLKEANDSANLQWMDKFAKKCPKCSVAIVKNGGCNVMTCAGCHCVFCWFCLTPFSNLIHNCVFRNNIMDVKEQDKLKKLDLTQYFGAFERWKILTKSLETERRFNYSISWVKELHKLLIRAREFVLGCIIFHFYSFNVTLYKLDSMLSMKNRKNLRRKKKKRRKKGSEEEENVKSETELTEIRKQVSIFRNLFLFHVEQMESKVEMFSKQFEDFTEEELNTKERKFELQAQGTALKKLMKNIINTCNKKDSYYVDEYSV